jgi:hypothetical protein
MRCCSTVGGNSTCGLEVAHPCTSENTSTRKLAINFGSNLKVIGNSD